MSARMDEMKKSSLWLTRDKQQPIKTEWSPRYVLFTYFHGDINSVVDEHFSRALSNTKRPNKLSTQDRSEAAIPNGGHQVRPNHWNFTSPWPKPHPEFSTVTSSNLAGCTMAVTQVSPPLMIPSPPLQLGQLWHWPSPVASPILAEPGYPLSFPTFHLMPGNEYERKYGSLFNLLQQDRYLMYPMPPARKQARHSSLGTGAPNLSPTGISSFDQDTERNAVSPAIADSPGRAGEVKGPK